MGRCSPTATGAWPRAATCSRRCRVMWLCWPSRRWPRPLSRRWRHQHEASGLTVREFAESIGVRAGTLSWWRWHLGRTRKRRTSSAFVELVIAEPQVHERPLLLNLDRLGVDITVHPGTDLALLRRTLEALC